MILGESGTGKEVTARFIHNQSRRKDGPFVPVECSAMPGSLIESELFGYERGAFTGAEKTKKGLIESADGGTLFLDEIGDLGVELQTRLFRFVEERDLRRLGGLTPVAWIAAFCARPIRTCRPRSRRAHFARSFTIG